MTETSAWETDEAAVSCLGCGQAMPPRAGLPVCSSAWRQRERRARRRREMRQLCADCGEVFIATRSNRFFCSAACRQRAWRERKAGRSTRRVRTPPFRVREDVAPARAPVQLDRAGSRAIDIASLIG